MGITGIYKEIGPGERIALSKLAVEKFEQTGHPLRIAIDTSIWLFQIQSGKGGTNPALRTFYYRLLRLLSLSIHPLFVFDGPNKPPFKRNKRTGPNVASIPEFLAKQLLKQFGFPLHLAPGEAEAECALLQREGIVDVVLTEDVDALMFGSGRTLRNWTPQAKSKVPTHVNLYDAAKIKAGPAGLDREGMILVALMSGGDYLPEGIPGCGPKIACEAAKAGFGQQLCAISKGDKTAIQAWKEKLAHELRTNESKFFKRKHGALRIPEDFPRADILGYYTNPAISSREGLERLKSKLRWDQDLDFPSLRTFTADAFEWEKLGGAKKFIRNLAPALLVRQLLMRGQSMLWGLETPEATEEAERKLITSIHGKRHHPSTDNTPELRIAYTPIEIVNIDLSIEEPDDELEESGDSEDEMPLPMDEDGAPEAEIAKKRGPSLYDPTKLEKLWVLESFVKVGVPLTVQDWEESQQRKAASKCPVAKAAKPRRTAATDSIQSGALNRFAKISKPGITGPPSSTKNNPIDVEKIDLSKVSQFQQSRGQSPRISKSDVNAPKSSAKAKAQSIDRLDLSGRMQHKNNDHPQSTFRMPPGSPKLPESTTVAAKEPINIDLLSSPVLCNTAIRPQEETLDEHYLSPNVTKRARRTLRRTESAPVDHDPAAQPLPSIEQPPAVHTAGEIFTSSSLSPVRELAPTRPVKTKVRESRPSSRQSTTPPLQRVSRDKSITLSPSRRQITIEESFSRSGSVMPRATRHTNAASEKDSSFMQPVVEVEEVDLTGSSPPRQQERVTRSKTPSQELDADPELPSVEELTRRSTRQRASKAISTSTSSLKAPRSVLTELSYEPQRPKRQQGQRPIVDSTTASCIPMSGEDTVPMQCSPRHQPTSGGANLVAATDNTFKEPPTFARRKKLVKLRESLEGSWKFVDADIEPLDMTDERIFGSSGSTVKAAAAGAAPQRKRKEWRKSEVEVIDLSRNG